MKTLAVFGWVALLVASGVRAEDAAPAPPPPQRAVLVTGASTGIGHKITERLAAEGFLVYAGARKDKDLAALNEIHNVRAIRLDVTSPADIAAAVDTIGKAGGLYALVNNAGVVVVGPLTQARDEDLDYTFGVNVYGPVRVTRAFAPLILASHGRITTIGSISGTLSSKDLGIYSMSKHAVEAFTDSLAGELAVTAPEVQVSVIEPGNYRSEIGATAAARAGVTSRLADRSQYKEPDEVADAVLHALTDASPKRRYMVVPDQHEAEITIRKAIEELVQLNEGQAYTYDRKALIEMLDAALAKTAPVH